jgi:hypothetical protein
MQAMQIPFDGTGLTFVADGKEVTLKQKGNHLEYTINGVRQHRVFTAGSLGVSVGNCGVVTVVRKGAYMYATWRGDLIRVKS